MSTTQIPDVTVLAAIDRAERHRGRLGIPVWLIFEHLGIPRRARRVRAQTQSPLQDGAIEQRRAHGVDIWALAPNGRRRLQGAGRVDLPESPQHRDWRNARRSPRRRSSDSAARRMTRSSRRVRYSTTRRAPMPGSSWPSGFNAPHGDSGRRPTACTSGWSPATIGPISTTTSAWPIWRSTRESVSDAKLAALADATLGSGRTRILRDRTRRFDRPPARSCGWWTDNSLAAFSGLGSLTMMAATKPPQDAPAPAAAPLSPLLDATEAGRLLSVPASWVLAEARANRIPHVRLGRYVRFSADELEEWWRARMRGPWRARGTASRTARSLLVDRSGRAREAS